MYMTTVHHTLREAANNKAVQAKVMETINRPFMQLTAAFRKCRLLELTSITNSSMVLDFFNTK